MGVFEGLNQRQFGDILKKYVRFPDRQRKKVKLSLIYWIGQRNTIWRQNGMMQVTC